MNVLWCCCSSIYSCLLCEFIGTAVWQSLSLVQMEELQARYGSFSDMDRVLKGGEGKIKSLHQIFLWPQRVEGACPIGRYKNVIFYAYFFLHFRFALIFSFFSFFFLHGGITKHLSNNAKYELVFLNFQATPVFMAIYLHALEAKGVYNGRAPKADFIQFVCIPNSGASVGVESRILGWIKFYFVAFLQRISCRLIRIAEFSILTFTGNVLV